MLIAPTGSVITLLITIVFNIQLEHVNKNPLLCLRSRNSGETRSTKQKEKTLIFHILIISIRHKKFNFYIYIYIYIYITAPLRVERSINLFYSSSRFIYI